MKYILLLGALCPLLSVSMQPQINNNDELISASIRGDVPRIRALIADGANVNYNSYIKGAPLNLAASLGKIAAMRELLALGADPNIVVLPANSVPLSTVLNSYKQGTITRNNALQAAGLLLEAGADTQNFQVIRILRQYSDLNEFLNEAYQLRRSRLP